MMKNRKFRKPRMKHGYVVNVIYDAILDLIYGDKGYYLDYSEPDDVIWEDTAVSVREISGIK